MCGILCADGNSLFKRRIAPERRREADVFGKVVAVALGTTVVAGAAAVLGYRGYEAFLRWLTADQRALAAESVNRGAQ